MAATPDASRPQAVPIEDGQPTSALPIDPAQPPETRRRQALLIARNLGIIGVGAIPAVMKEPDQVKQLEKALALAGIDMPTGTKDVYYLIYVTAPDGGPHTPMLVLDHELLPVLLALALARGGRKVADQLLYRTGMLPE